MKTPNAAEIAVELAKKLAARDIYILAVEAEKSGKTLSEFIETLKALIDKA